VHDAMGLLKSATGFTRRIEPPAGTGPSILSLKVEMVGSINSPQELHVYGSIEGTVRAASVTVCKGGSIKGDVIGETVNVHGTVEGRIFAQTARVLAGGAMRGEIIHAAVGIDTAAIFEGSVKRTSDPLGEAPAMPKKN